MRTGCPGPHLRNQANRGFDDTEARSTANLACQPHRPGRTGTSG